MNKQMLRGVIFAGLFLIPFVPFLVSSSLFFPFITTKAFAWRAIVEVIFAAWVVLALWDKQYRPKRSIILYAVLAFLAVIGLADLLGVDRAASFWSNFERMEGYISLLHLGAFFLVISSIFEEKHWTRWWNTSLAASAIMAGYALLQVWGVLQPSQDLARVDGTFGNAIYLAVYMLIHIFVALLLMAREWRNKNMRWTYSLLIIFQIIIIYYTATRGAILGLLGGLLVMAVINSMNKEDRSIRKASIAVIVGLAVLVGGFFMVKDSAFVAKSPVLSRFSTLTLADIKTQGRYFVWPIALEGFKERPILGWGQENFSYVFQEHYKPEMFILEPWFDRAHNIFLDWAVVGGLLGLLAYLLLYAAYLRVVWRGGNRFSFAEKSILTGLISAYFFHNFFVFDHLTSYVLFFSLLAYLHSHATGELLWIKDVSETRIKSLAVPAAAVLLVLALYFVNAKPLMGNVYTIEALKAVQLKNPPAAATYFEKAYQASLLGRPEVVEHMSSNVPSILGSNISAEEKNSFYSFAKAAVEGQAKKFSNSARTELIAGSFFSGLGLLDDAKPYFERAKELSPGKQLSYFELGAIAINQGRSVEALELFKQAYEMAPGYNEAKIIYLAGAIYAGDRALERELMSGMPERLVVFDDRIVSAYYATKRFGDLTALFGRRKALDPQNAATYDEYIRQIRNQ
ncbi:MAG: hypothetical protein A3J09_00140 [Candidatus Zambryskibacteria bacterium RIFCSPLOWO2_02_FULL_51_21]|uniref:O-antigen ligase-related domain-containing protein n=1 Tax=Candidatus Zambryskibacteria bacterium RIFCSPHIGHO2_02_FULL_43_37 TaxID=1802749 RepID=A0A1G2THU7_9BACT|nr:MAG: hypothetical protein A2723_00140 [Candidatus Zambryskibacteria bacterium RIFCSPHIGHO2_01_FULL_52_18]OHA96870.1 MAG: hypothetical protein A3D49_02040 [Candidatus Zambryskibacteria bacterium RIFCSPHIGHO2_02_FULL_43_37]OHB07071.1 MAG: hypothetical protein A2944_02315 [Candidatus Zambryskibacteria bacterium RIFCSPLOWO2_01_FULL_52_12]OHB10982.1 MAG: hypothetical protein A3J09_00140 [Candidatus Zambryskibacteria bacterium RIFCSPLOWO2_02_FULL_51_21]